MTLPLQFSEMTIIIIISLSLVYPTVLGIAAGTKGTAFDKVPAAI